ncbi:hypothetical protein LJC10_05340 [Selenomonadales bacterium OttesenSCG-928-I06]|nr:hypothetical protein [Selenomonadales bacterium OttesenSCG-928-I06]
MLTSCVLNLSSHGSPNSTNHNQYLKKVWVGKKWDNLDSFSFFITKIENGVVEGKISRAFVEMPDCYTSSFHPSEFLTDFSGILNDGVAECQFSSKSGKKRNLRLTFKKNGEIEAEVKYDRRVKGQSDVFEPYSINNVFRPYNLTDVRNITVLKEHSFPIELNYWGKVNFVSAKINIGSNDYPAAYLTNEHGDILYEFEISTKIEEVASMIIGVLVEDMSNTSLKRIKIISHFPKAPEVKHIEKTFIQMNNGLFYDSKLDAKDEIVINEDDFKKQKQLAMEAYKGIMQNNIRFLYVLKGDYVFLNEWLFKKEPLKQFTVVDLDGDGLPEVVLCQPVGSKFILHYEDGVVYGNLLGMRGEMSVLKKDGTYASSYGSGIYGYGKIRFLSGILDKKSLARCSEQVYYINHEKVSEDLFLAFREKQWEKENVVWYPFSEGSISEDFLKAWDNYE